MGRGRSGATAVEFALIAPLFFALGGGALGLGLGFWTKSALQETASEGARCVAIGSPACMTADAACPGGLPGACYFTTLAARRGVGNVSADQVAIDRTALVGGVSFTTITVTYPFSLIGYAFPMTLVGHFPNPV